MTRIRRYLPVAAIAELSEGDRASLLHMLDALVTKNRLKALAGRALTRPFSVVEEDESGLFGRAASSGAEFQQKANGFKDHSRNNG